MALAGVVHRPNRKPLLQRTGSPHPHTEADLGVHGLKEVTIHFVSWVKASAPLDLEPPPAKRATVSPVSPHVTRAVGTKAPRPREKESWIAQEAGFSGGLRVSGQKRGSEEGRGDSPGGSEGMGQSKT